MQYDGQLHQYGLHPHLTTDPTKAKEDTNHPKIQEIKTKIPYTVIQTTTPTTPSKLSIRNTNTPNITETFGNPIPDNNSQTLWLLSKPQTVSIPKCHLYPNLRYNTPSSTKHTQSSLPWPHQQTNCTVRYLPSPWSRTKTLSNTKTYNIRHLPHPNVTATWYPP